jgi:hypothetical protein
MHLLALLSYFIISEWSRIVFLIKFHQCFVTWKSSSTSLSGLNGKEVVFVVKFSPSLLRYLNYAHYWTRVTTTSYTTCGSVNVSLI